MSLHPRQRHVQCASSAGLHRIAYLEWGEPDNPQVLVCVHGLTRCARDFDNLARALSDRYHVVCPDVAGRGDSDWLADPMLYDIPQYVADMVTLIARLDVEQVHWVGTSMGGLIGMLLAAKRNSPIGRLVMNDVGPFVPWNGLLRLKGHLGRPRGFASLNMAGHFLREALASFGPLTEPQWQHLIRHSVHQRDDRRWYLRFDPAIGQWNTQSDPELPIGPEFLRGLDLWAMWNAVDCPVLVLRGAQSEVLLAATVEEMRRRKPETQSVEFEGVGHAPALFDARQIDAVRAFLKQRRGASQQQRAAG